MRRGRIWAGILALGLVAALVPAVASAAPGDPCESAYSAPMNSTEKLRKYLDCRLDRLERGLTPSPAPTVTITASPSASPAPSDTPTASTTPTVSPSTSPTAPAALTGWQEDFRGRLHGWRIDLQRPAVAIAAPAADHTTCPTASAARRAASGGSRSGARIRRGPA